MTQTRLFHSNEDPIRSCRLCHLHETRNLVVLPSGNLGSKVAFVGEAPGENEDKAGRPFIGIAGSMLDNALRDAGVDRTMVMITNAVKCRPPGNRDPTTEEMASCRPYLEDELYDKELVVGLGKSACRSLMGYEGRMMEIVNKVQIIRIKGRDIDFLPTYHPMYCIYNKRAREMLGEAMAMVKERCIRDGR